jgi:heme O synthase-like polyprenyltransferase
MLLDVPTLLLSTYIFSWQFPHFYGILYEHKDDYKKAGFIMTSNDDPTGNVKAYNQMYAATVLNTIVPCAMAGYGVLHPVFLLAYLPCQVQAFRALFTFKEQ